jgi:hypothetical protein
MQPSSSSSRASARVHFASPLERQSQSDATVSAVAVSRLESPPASSQEASARSSAARLRRGVPMLGRYDLERVNDQGSQSGPDSPPAGWVRPLPKLRQSAWVMRAIEACSSQPANPASTISLENNFPTPVAFTDRRFFTRPRYSPSAESPAQPTSWELYATRSEREGALEARPPHPLRFTDRRFGGS